jgi:predicted dinucleotide-binding enzyme
MKIGIIGAGMIGSTVGKLWVEAGHEVRFASRHPEQLQPLAEKLGARADSGIGRSSPLHRNWSIPPASRSLVVGHPA